MAPKIKAENWTLLKDKMGHKFTDSTITDFETFQKRVCECKVSADNLVPIVNKLAETNFVKGKTTKKEMCPELWKWLGGTVPKKPKAAAAAKPKAALANSDVKQLANKLAAILLEAK